MEMKLTNFIKKGEMKYDWNKIKKRYNDVIKYELKQCDIKIKNGENSDFWKNKKESILNAYNPTSIDMGLTNWIMNISIRASGKTTNWLGIGLVMNVDYGCITQYVRISPDSITPKALNELYSTFELLDVFSYLTNGKYNSYYYYANSFRFANRDSNGNIDKKNLGQEFTHCHATDNVDNIKSSYVCDVGDLIIFDEFMRSRYSEREFQNMSDVFHTISRFRKEVWYILLANNLSPYNGYLRELGVDREIRRMQWGQKKIIQSGITPLYVEMIQPNELQTDIKKEININMFRWGFNNSKIASINGLTTWNIKQYPHLSDDMKEEDSKIVRYAYVKLSTDILRIEIHKSKNYGYYAYCVHCKSIKDNRIVYTLDIPEKNEVRGFGYRKIDKEIWRLYDTHRFYYATNECGQMIEEFVNESKNLTK